ncbi:hypothetical protein ScPMuIL_010047 [Solemya velum]
MPRERPKCTKFEKILRPAHHPFSCDTYRLEPTELAALELQDLNHPYISGFKEFFVTWDKENSSMFICFVMDYFPDGNLEQVIEKNRATKTRIKEQTIKDWLGQIVGALLYLHDENVAHRDLRPTNIYIKEDGKLCLGDFGVATVMGDAMTCTRATSGLLNYLPPEAPHTQTNEQCSDVWALGCVLFEAVTTTMLDAAQCDQKLAEIREDPGVLEVVFEDIAQYYSGELITVMRKMLRRNLDSRSTDKPRETIKELQCCDYIKSCVELTLPSQVEKRVRQKSAKCHPKQQIPKDQGVMTVLEYMANMVDFESAVQQSLEYFLEMAKEEGGNIQLLGCKLYNHLVVGIEQTDVLYSREIIAVITEAMGTHPASVELQKAAAALLKALSNSDRAAADIGSLDGVKYVLEALEEHRSEPELCAICCTALWNLTVNEQNMRLATANRGVSRVCEALKVHMNSPDVVEAASAALLSLSLEDKNIKCTGEVNAVGLLVCAVNTHIKNPKVVKNACLALASLVEADEESSYRVLTNHGPDGKHIAGVPIIIKAYELHKDNAEVVESIVTLFMELTEKDDLHHEMHHLKVGPMILKEVFRRYKENPDIMEPCEKAIENLMKTGLAQDVQM